MLSGYFITMQMYTLYVEESSPSQWNEMNLNGFLSIHSLIHTMTEWMMHKCFIQKFNPVRQ